MLIIVLTSGHMVRSNTRKFLFLYRNFEHLKTRKWTQHRHFFRSLREMIFGLSIKILSLINWHKVFDEKILGSSYSVFREKIFWSSMGKPFGFYTKTFRFSTRSLSQRMLQWFQEITVWSFMRIPFGLSREDLLEKLLVFYERSLTFHKKTFWYSMK